MKAPAILTCVGILAGGLAGWLYWKYFGCTGSCLITSKPVNSLLYGAVMGGLLFYTITSFFSKNNKS
jgi:hypothetical protein